MIKQGVLQTKYEWRYKTPKKGGITEMFHLVTHAGSHRTSDPDTFVFTTFKMNTCRCYKMR